MSEKLESVPTDVDAEIQKRLELQKLKATAYDLIAKREEVQRRLSEVNQRIAELS